MGYNFHVGLSTAYLGRVSEAFCIARKGNVHRVIDRIRAEAVSVTPYNGIHCVVTVLGEACLNRVFRWIIEIEAISEKERPPVRRVAAKIKIV